AFAAAGDPKRFPEQLKYVTPWKPKRIVWNRYSRGNQTIPDEEKATLTTLEVGDYNRLLGKSYTEIAGISRSMHKSQGFGDSQDRGQFTQYFRHTAGNPAKNDLLDGIDLTWNRIQGGQQIGEILEQTANNFDASKPERSIPQLLNAYALMQKIQNNPWVETKKADLLLAIRGCAGLWLEAISAQRSITPGSEIKVTATAINRSAYPFQIESVEIVGAGLRPARADHETGDGGRDESRPHTALPLPYNEPVSNNLTVQIPAEAHYSQPYWLREQNSKPFSTIKDQRLIGQPLGPTALEAHFTVTAGSHRLIYSEPVLYREVDPIEGDVYQEFVVVPEIALNIQDPVVVYP
ncbi:MAG: hypothetical protein ACRD4B_03590, partial [Acidobacteriota bacterium]